MRTSSGLVGTPAAVSMRATASRSSGTPAEVEYCRATFPFVSSTQSDASEIAFTGKPSGEGRPPAKLMTSGRAARARISPTAVGPFGSAMVLY